MFNSRHLSEQNRLIDELWKLHKPAAFIRGLSDRPCSFDLHHPNGLCGETSTVKKWQQVLLCTFRVYKSLGRVSIREGLGKEEKSECKSGAGKEMGYSEVYPKSE